jgi:chemosensory pili system protein ChpA (sensor histidine kinase/response regulator)
MGTIPELPHQTTEISIPVYIDTDICDLNTKVAISSDISKDDIEKAKNETIKGIAKQEDLVRIPIKYLDEMVKLVGELVISRSIFEQHLSNLLHQVNELHLSIDRLQRISTIIETQYEVSTLVSGHSTIYNTNSSGLSRAGSEWTGIVEFDDLEFDRYSDFHLMSRDLTETSADIGALGTEFRDILSEFDAFLTRQSRLTSEIQDKLMHFRMIPLSSLTTRLHRAVRVTAKQTGKEVNLVIEGEEIQLDKSMLDELNEALLHLLRNAVDHGIESPDERVRIGKQHEGTINLNLFREGTQIVVQKKEDGAGLNPHRIRAQAVQNGLVSEAEIESWQDEKVYSLIFSPGFSTNQQVSVV